MANPHCMGPTLNIAWKEKWPEVVIYMDSWAQVNILDMSRKNMFGTQVVYWYISLGISLLCIMTNGQVHQLQLAKSIVIRAKTFRLNIFLIICPRKRLATIQEELSQMGQTYYTKHMDLRGTWVNYSQCYGTPLGFSFRSKALILPMTRVLTADSSQLGSSLGITLSLRCCLIKFLPLPQRQFASNDSSMPVFTASVSCVNLGQF